MFHEYLILLFISCCSCYSCFRFPLWECVWDNAEWQLTSTTYIVLIYSICALKALSTISPFTQTHTHRLTLRKMHWGQLGVHYLVQGCSSHQPSNQQSVCSACWATDSLNSSYAGQCDFLHPENSQLSFASVVHLNNFIMNCVGTNFNKI